MSWLLLLLLSYPWWLRQLFCFSNHCLQWVLLLSIQKPHHAPLPRSRAWLSHSSLSSMGSGKKTASKKMSWFLIFSIRGIEIKDILGSRMCDELCEDKRQDMTEEHVLHLLLSSFPKTVTPPSPLPTYILLISTATLGRHIIFLTFFLCLKIKNCKQVKWCEQVNGLWKVSYYYSSAHIVWNHQKELFSPTWNKSVLSNFQSRPLVFRISGPLFLLILESFRQSKDKGRLGPRKLKILLREWETGSCCPLIN